jgi:hypothetical protein
MWDHFTRDARGFLKLELLFLQAATVVVASVGVAILFLRFFLFYFCPSFLSWIDKNFCSGKEN